MFGPRLMSTRIKRVKAMRQRRDIPWMGIFFNKENGREYAAQFGLQGASIIGRYDRVDDLPELSELPSSVVIKPVDGNGNRGVFCLRDRIEIMDETPVSRSDILHTFSTLGPLADSAVIAEEFIQDWSGRTGLPRDYKFYNFGGYCAFLHIVERNHRKDQTKNRHWFIREDGSPFPYQFTKSQVHCNTPAPLPPYFKDMLRVAKAMSAEMNTFARVDLYASESGPLFGEMTAFPHGGNGYLPEADRYLGGLWRGIYGADRLDFIRHFRETRKL